MDTEKTTIAAGRVPETLIPRIETLARERRWSKATMIGYLIERGLAAEQAAE